MAVPEIIPISYEPDYRGRLAALVADPAQGFTPIPHFSGLRPPSRYDTTAVICDGVEIREIPLIEIDADGVRSVTPTPSHGAPAWPSPVPSLPSSISTERAAASAGRSAGPAGRTEPSPRRIASTCCYQTAGTRPGWARGKIGRDGTLWLHEGGDPRRWYRYEVDT
ncbi:hypothetical protein Aros01_03942 [Streptosporangium roseum]|uniref:Uncharacterized protein n=1 Tax=Streptosporangium roseum (strain ATCC 12428 / DSM 43021 / JCM 3005 / KCTC 9067 / NCIMB 10171 / NRRL 2505 / NI 9100) TaxID=479432 RepID=D2AS57_STRRD|nr:hypothetical protein Sros_3655 [Streptosporangium roseum DSM 43021]